MGTEYRDPKTDPQPGDTIHDQFGERWTVDSVDALGVRFTDGSGMTLRTWRGYFDDPNYTVTAADGDAPAEGSDAPAGTADPSPLDRLGTDAQTLVTLLQAAALAAAPGTPKYARDAAEGWLRGVFAATYGTAASDAPATERDPRTDPQVGDTYTDIEGDVYTVTAVREWGDMEVRCIGWEVDEVWTHGTLWRDGRLGDGRGVWAVGGAS